MVESEQMINSTRRLTPKQQRFIQAYLLNGGIGSAAARTAGYRGNDQTLRAVASETLTKPNVVDAISAARRATQERNVIDRDSLVAQLDSIGRDPEARHGDRIQAIMGQARLLGYVVDRREVRAQVDHLVRPLAAWSVEELEAAVQRGQALEATLSLPPARAPGPV